MSRAVILMYHQVDVPVTKKEQRFCVPPCEFRRQIDWLRHAGYRFVNLHEIFEHVTGIKALTEKCVHITFDDGFIGVLEHAWPTLKEHNIPATLFALSGEAGETNHWMQRRGFPRRAILSKAQLQELSREGMLIGSHTRTHPRLPEIPLQQAKEEIQSSKQELESILGEEITAFAYPYGLFNDRIRTLVDECDYRCACSTRPGFNREGEDPLLLRRIDVFGTDKLWQFRQKITFGTNESNRLQPVLYYIDRIVDRIVAPQ